MLHPVAACFAEFLSACPSQNCCFTCGDHRSLNRLQVRTSDLRNSLKEFLKQYHHA
jgi:hypothetical protein